MANSHSSLEMRIRRLESQNRVFAIALMGAALLAVLGATHPLDVSRASAFQLTDEDGNVRAELAIRDGTVGLFLKDEEGHDRLQAFHDSEATGIYIHDEEGTNRVGVAQFAHGGGGFALHGPESRGAAVLYLKGEGSLRFFDHEGNVTNQVLAKVAEEE
jgi:hypothetical protein